MEILINLSIAFGVSIGINVLFFAIAFPLKKDLFTDITYASTFLITTLIVMVILNSYGINQYLALALVGLWSIRLGTFLFIRIYKIKVDHRFDNIRNSFSKFLGFWLLQGLTVWVVNMPTYVVMLAQNTSFSWWSIIPFVLALCFLTWETVADLQKYLWNNKNKGQFINIGLWKVSRHPNYFGEYSFWIMMTIFALVSSYNDYYWFVLISPIFIMTMIYQISGVPLLEKSGLKQFGHDPNYLTYLNKTPCVIPFVGKKGYKTKWKS